jgi:hypothetical protein
VTENHRRDFGLYETFSDMTPMWPVKEISDPNGYTPIECHVYQETYGKIIPCNDIVKLRQVQHGKKMVNLQIKMWVDTTIELPITLLPTEVKEICRDYPNWVFQSYMQQLKKRHTLLHGFVPKYITLFLDE